MVVHSVAHCQPKACNEAWSLEFVDQLSNGQKFRTLTRSHYSAEEKIRGVLDGLRGEVLASPTSDTVFRTEKVVVSKFNSPVLLQ